MDTQNKVENEIVSTSKETNAREELGSNTGKVEREEQPLCTWTSQDRKEQERKSELTIK